jgi:hypothetical protein
VQHRTAGTGAEAQDGGVNAKYYTQFLLSDASQRRGVREYSGVVEVSRELSQPVEARDIEMLLARNLACEAGQVRLIDWSRLH